MLLLSLALFSSSLLFAQNGNDGFVKGSEPAPLDISPSAAPTSVTLGHSTTTVESVTLGQKPKKAKAAAVPVKAKSSKAAKASAAKAAAARKMTAKKASAVAAAAVVSTATATASPLPEPDGPLSPAVVSTSTAAAVSPEPGKAKTAKAAKKPLKKKKISSPYVPEAVAVSTGAAPVAVSTGAAQEPVPEPKMISPFPDEPAPGAQEAVSTAAVQAEFARNFSQLEFGKVQGPGMRISVRFAGTSVAEDFLDITAPFDGKITTLSAKLFQWTGKGDDLGVVASSEMAAMMASSSKGKVDKDMSKVYNIAHLKAPATGLVVKVNVQKGSMVYEGDRLLTVARKFYILAKTAKKLYVPLQKGMDAELTTRDGFKVKARLDRFSEIESTGRYLLRLEVVSRDASLQPGMVFSGEVILVDHPLAAKVPVSALFQHDGKTYLFTMTEVETGMRDEGVMELTSGAQPDGEFIYPASLMKIGRGK